MLFRSHRVHEENLDESGIPICLMAQNWKKNIKKGASSHSNMTTFYGSQGGIGDSNTPVSNTGLHITGSQQGENSMVD